MLLTSLAAGALLASTTFAVVNYDLQVANTGGFAMSPLLYGIMWEDINYCSDGGLYAEMINNRAFQGSTEHPASLNAWSAVGTATLALDNSGSLSSALRNSVKVTEKSGASGAVGIQNSGYWGFDVKPQTYQGSFYVKGAYTGSFTASLKSTTGVVWATAAITGGSTAGTWTKYTYKLVPANAAPNAKNVFTLTYNPAQATTPMNFNLIQLFPPTWNNRANGLRKDLMSALQGLRPTFLRFPGGNNLEGDFSPFSYKWQDTIGPIVNRPSHAGTWGYENTNGLGLIEYLLWCDDLGMLPLLAVWDGLYLKKEVIAQANLQPYIQDALNQIEFITGSASTTWGAKRAALGYPNPWKLTYIEIGNEDMYSGGMASYNAYRFNMFHDAIKAKYPNLIIMGSTPRLTPVRTGAALDYHIYTSPDGLASKYNFFDNYILDHKMLVGEYAVINGNPGSSLGAANTNGGRALHPFWIGSVAEAVYLLGIEKNSNHVIGSAYAPLFQNMNSYTWTPDLISFTADPADTTLSTSYYVFRLFSSTLGTTSLPVTASAKVNPLYWAASKNDKTGQHILKLANYNGTAGANVNAGFDGYGAGAKALLTLLTAPSATSFNSPGNTQIKQSTTTITAGSGGKFAFAMPNLSVAVLVTA